MSLVLTRMEEKHRSITDVFRYMDQRGKGKVRKNDFVSAIDRMRISLAREDVQKVWNYIDSSQQGFITMPELSLAYQNRINDFNKTVEVAVEQRAVKSFRNQEGPDVKHPNFAPSPQTQVAKVMTYKGLHSQRDATGDKPHSGIKSPMMTKSIDHAYGIHNLASDNIGQVVSNKFMQDAYAL